MQIIETTDEFTKFKVIYDNAESILIPILSDYRKHICNNIISVLYIKIIDGDDYILPFTHNDCTCLPLVVLDHIDNNQNKVVLDKKQFLKIKKLKKLIDIQSLFYIKTSSTLDIKIDELSVEKFYKTQYPNMDNIYDIIPITKLYEKYRKIAIQIESIYKDSISMIDDYAFKSFDTSIEIFSDIEKIGVSVDRDSMKKYFPNYDIHIKDNIIYSEYNLYTLTGRPSNKFGQLNFSALNKSNGERESIVSRYGDRGRLLYMDYTAYHLYLIANLIGYEFESNVSIHEHLGRFYFGKDKLTEEEYNQSKEISFTLLYGKTDYGIAKEIPFFAKVNEYIDKLYIKYSSDLYLETVEFKRKIRFNKLTNKNILFNYIIQSYETEHNILILEKLLKFLDNTDIKLMLYLYDGFLFDINLDTINSTDIQTLKKIMTEDNKYPVKSYYGNNFQNLVKT